MRLIDADAMREGWLKYGANEYIYDANAMLYDIDEQPTIDAVPVVRCKDCKHYGTSGCAMDTYAFDVVEEGFCSYGERKEAAP